MDTHVNLSEMENVQISEEFGNQGLDGEVQLSFSGDYAGLTLALSYEQTKALWDLLTPYFTPIDEADEEQEVPA